ncbi:hypothetical protein FPHOBKDP_00105 [Listeria phage LPJP1]|nr:hypothetical protein FPHOBKDP_00105 [Listeria phage LPJP1]
MGKLVSNNNNGNNVSPIEKDIVNNYIGSYIEGTSAYSKLLENAPNFVTYYSKNTRSSNEDPGLGGTVEYVGSESSLLYNKIKNFPVFSVNEINPTFNFEEGVGLDTELESQAIVLPKTIIPLPDDYLTFSYHEKGYEYFKTYRINNVSTSSIGSNTYYSITFINDPIDIRILEERQVDKTYRFVYENVGTTDKVIIEEDDILLIDKIEKICGDINERYINNFYNSQLGILLYENLDESLLYSPNLHYFINKNQVFINNRTFMRNVYIEDITKVKLKDYNKSLFSIIDNGYNNINMSYQYITRVLENNILKKTRGLYVEDLEIIGSSCNIKIPRTTIHNYFSVDINDLINNYDGVDSLNGIDAITSIITIYLEQPEQLSINTLFNLVSKLNYDDYSISNYFFIPCVLSIINIITNKNYYTF